jgi:hypothetical protein
MLEGREGGTPRLVAEYWEKQTAAVLSAFFGKGSGSKDAGLVPPLLASPSKKEATMEGDRDVPAA